MVDRKLKDYPEKTIGVSITEKELKEKMVGLKGKLQKLYEPGLPDAEGLISNNITIKGYTTSSAYVYCLLNNEYTF